MDQEDDEDFSPRKPTLLGTATAAVGFGAFALGLWLLGRFVEEFYELQFICDADNCMEDPRSSAERHVVLLCAFIGTLLAFVGCLVAWRRRRAVERERSASTTHQAARAFDQR